MAEIWDAYDKSFSKIRNMKLVRGEPIPKGMYHLVCDVIVRHVDGTYLLMQRDPRKHRGGKWELTAGGSALAGEAPLDCAKRELQEETGITASHLRELQRISHEGHRCLYVEYLCVTDWDKTAVTLQEGETVNFQWVEKSAILEMEETALATTRTRQLI